MQEIDKLFLAKLADKRNAVQKKHTLEATDFLDAYQLVTAQKWFKEQKWKQVYFTGGLEPAERNIAILYPDKLATMLEELEGKEKVEATFLSAIHIQLPKEIDPYTHKQYLGALMKLGVKREKIGDICVHQQGADILIKKEIETYLLQALPQLTRFSKSNIQKIKLQQIQWEEPPKVRATHIVPSLRLDACIAELAGCSRSKAIQIIEEQRIWVNGELQTKRTRELKEQDNITIRGKGRYKLVSIQGTTKKGNTMIEIEKNT